MVLIIRLLPKHCSCLRRLGTYQREYENLIKGGLKPAQAASKMGWNKMCCRNQVMNASMYFIKDANKDAFRDETGLVSRTEHHLNQIVTRDNPPVVPKRPQPPFPALPTMITPTSPRRAPVISLIETIKPLSSLPSIGPSLPVPTPRVGTPATPQSVTISGRPKSRMVPSALPFPSVPPTLVGAAPAPTPLPPLLEAVPQLAPPSAAIRIGPRQALPFPAAT